MADVQLHSTPVIACDQLFILITRAHSFPRPAEFGFFRGFLNRGIYRGIFFSPRNLTFFIRTTIFSQKITSK